MKPGNLLYEQITEDMDNFSLKGKIKPTFYNFGTDTVDILHAPVAPGGPPFDGGAEGVIMQNGIPIRFHGDDIAGRNVICYYVSIDEEQSNCNI